MDQKVSRPASGMQTRDIEVQRIDEAHAGDVRLPNEPFPLWGRLRPAYENGVWRFDAERFPAEQVSEMCFPDEPYDFHTMCADTVFLGAYTGETCVGLAVLRDATFRYFYLYDLKVCRAQRGQGVGLRLIEGAKREAAARGYRGVYTVAQDNNLSACLFYLRAGFRIGGLDTEVYRGTKQEGKADVLFYLDL